ncbi:hypothetical protein L3X38_044477 [Prunus dulcis]|uniref:AP complex mu/sigma subunit domain-containing protein n=1 Tax=Prunus dulcis TaxID=3755 RepID=A0AAD4V0I6_PRUDU|nr:hypothetical protein L3X38_044477 [Prunus dulcis]
MIQFVLLISSARKSQVDKMRSNSRTRSPSSVILWIGEDTKLFNKRYASLYFCMCIDQEDNELEVLE